jgi:hypothetical protein
MKNQSFSLDIWFDAPASIVFQRIPDIPIWWTKDFEGSSSHLNDEFIICHPGSHYSKQLVVEVIPNRKIVWLVMEGRLDWLEKDKSEWTDTKMVFELSAIGDKTLLHFTHDGLFPEKECYARCSEGWTTVIMKRLFNYISFGQTTWTNH